MRDPSSRFYVQRCPPTPRPVSASQPRPQATMNKEKKKQIEKGRVKQEEKQAGWLACEPQLQIWPAYCLFLSILLGGKLSEPSSHQNKGVAFHSLLHRNKPAFSPSWGGRALVGFQQRCWSFLFPLHQGIWLQVSNPALQTLTGNSKRLISQLQSLWQLSPEAVL